VARLVGSRADVRSENVDTNIDTARLEARVTYCLLDNGEVTQQADDHDQGTDAEGDSCGK
jgi:hypothetical protein